MRLISTSGIVADSGTNICPAYGTFLSSGAGVVTLVDAAGISHTGDFVLRSYYANGLCGQYYEDGEPILGERAFPPNGWVYDYQTTGINTNDEFWSHPSNPALGQLASPSVYIPTNETTSYYTTYPQTNVAGMTKGHGELIKVVVGQGDAEGWFLKYYYDLYSLPYPYYTIVEDDISPL